MDQAFWENAARVIPPTPNTMTPERKKSDRLGMRAGTGKNEVIQGKLIKISSEVTNPTRIRPIAHEL